MAWIDSASFREALTERQDCAKTSLEGRHLAQRTKIRLLENQLKEATVGEFTILCDGAAARRGDDKAPSPLQYFVAAIGF